MPPPPSSFEQGCTLLVLDAAGQGSPHAVLDYLFNQPKAPSQSLRSALSWTQAQTEMVVQETDDTPAGTSKATLEKTIGPFSVSNVGVRYEDAQLTIYLDITAHLGPHQSCTAGLPIWPEPPEYQSPSDIVLQVPTFHLQGMGIEFSNPPVQIAGLFVERVTDNATMYVGGVALTIVPYSFMAVGDTAKVQNRDSGGSFKTVFFFAKLNGPLIELEFVTIGGICLGFGYNSSNSAIRACMEVPAFPFIANSSLPGGDPLSIMQKLSGADPTVGVVSPKETSYWLAAGLEAKALELLDISAVVIFEFNPYVSLGIFAKAIGQMPPAPTPREACFLYVELGLLANVDPGAGCCGSKHS